MMKALVNFLFSMLCIWLLLSCKEVKKAEKLNEKENFETSLKEMKAKSIKTIRYAEQFQKIKNKESIRLLCYFSSNEEDGSIKLSNDLGKMRYAVDSGPYSTDKPWVVNGRTPYMKFSEEIVLKWVEEMSLMAEKHNCKFEGWGIDNPLEN